MKRLPFDYAVRNLGRVPARFVLSLVGSVLVVLLVVAAAAFVRGMQSSLAVQSGANNVLLLSTGSEESIERSEIDPIVAEVAATRLSGVKQRLGEPYVSPEIHLALAIRSTREEPKGKSTVIRGIESIAYLVHSEVSFRDGRAPESGADEIAVGSLVSAKLGLGDEGLRPGSKLWIDDREWTVSGVFSAPQSVIDAEIWMPLSDLKTVGQRDFLSCVVITMDPDRGGSVADVEALVAVRIDLEASAMPEREYYRALASFFGPIRAMVLVTAGLIALGGILGGINTLYAAFASRVREVGTLQVIGYRRPAIVLSILQESILTTALGAVIACALALALLDGQAVRFSMGAFGLIVDAPVLALGLGAGILLGGVGALPPIVRCLRLPVNEALRA